MIRRAALVLAAVACLGCDGNRAPTQGEALLARARASGTWGAAERDGFRALLPRLGADERGQVLRDLGRAFNRRDLRLAGLRAPL